MLEEKKNLSKHLYYDWKSY